ncbi:nucleotidyltransferase domain-containing protein [Mesorhizobium sp. M1050]|uniref:nucleotidyltransferase domain-containing protein n=1 Tax=Mesorhizobium sp. M1050 TaxID=2957051 RepID=UPI00333C6353
MTAHLEIEADHLASVRAVRVLRELVRHGGFLSAPSLASRSGLAGSSARAALEKLEASGIVAKVGSGRVHLYRARIEHPLASSLEGLFEAEEVRFASLCEAIRSAASDWSPGVTAVWIYGSVARGEDRPDSDLDIVVVAESGILEGMLAAMRDALVEPGELFGFSPSVVGLAREDIVRLSRLRDPWWQSVAADAIVLVGARPDEFAPEAHG